MSIFVSTYALSTDLVKFSWNYGYNLSPVQQVAQNESLPHWPCSHSGHQHNYHSHPALPPMHRKVCLGWGWWTQSCCSRMARLWYRLGKMPLCGALGWEDCCQSPQQMSVRQGHHQVYTSSAVSPSMKTGRSALDPTLCRPNMRTGWHTMGICVQMHWQCSKGASPHTRQCRLVFRCWFGGTFMITYGHVMKVSVWTSLTLDVLCPNDSDEGGVHSMAHWAPLSKPSKASRCIDDSICAWYPSLYKLRGLQQTKSLLKDFCWCSCHFVVSLNRAFDLKGYTEHRELGKLTRSLG